MGAFRGITSVVASVGLCAGGAGADAVAAARLPCDPSVALCAPIMPSESHTPPYGVTAGTLVLGTTATSAITLQVATRDTVTGVEREGPVPAALTKLTKLIALLPALDRLQ